MIMWQRAGLDQGAHVRLRAPGRARRPRHLHPHGRLPGSGEALRLHGLTARIDTEAWAAACVDWLEARDDVDPARIGLVGWSLGGYYAPRAAAFEKRLALVVAWGANHDWGAVQTPPARTRGREPGPALLGARAVGLGRRPTSTRSSTSPTGVNLDGVVEQITVPFLIAHGAERPADPARVRPPLLRPGGQQPRNASCGSSRPEEGAHRAHRARPPPARQRLHRRLGGRHLRAVGDHPPRPHVRAISCANSTRPRTPRLRRRSWARVTLTRRGHAPPGGASSPRPATAKALWLAYKSPHRLEPPRAGEWLALHRRTGTPVHPMSPRRAGTHRQAGSHRREGSAGRPRREGSDRRAGPARREGSRPPDHGSVTTAAWWSVATPVACRPVPAPGPAAPPQPHQTCRPHHM